MATRQLTAARRIADQLLALEADRRRIAVEGLAALEREDPETARLAIAVFADRDKAATWLTHGVQSLGELTPWQCIADGNADQVRTILSAIAHGVFQ